MLENAELLLKGFFNELYNLFIPERRSAYNKKEDKKKVVNIYYLITAIHNKFVNYYPLKIRLYLAVLGSDVHFLCPKHLLS